MHTPDRRPLLRVLSFLLLAGTGTLLPYLALYLDSRGLSGREVGLVFGLMGAGRLVSGPGWPLLADALDRPVGMLAVSTAGLATACALALLPLPFAGLAAALVATAMCLAPSGALLDAETVRTIERQGGDPRDYGRVRLWGSVGFLALSFGAGLVADDHPAALVAVAAGLWGATALLVHRLPVTRVDADRAPVGPALRAALQDPVVAGLLVAAVPFGVAANAYDGFFSLHMRALGHASGWAGLGVAIGVAAEIAAMAYGRALLARWPAGALVVGALLVGGARHLATALLRDPLALALVQVLHGLTFGVWWLASVELLRSRVPPRVRATTLSLSFAASWGLGPLLCGALAARWLDGPGTPALFGAASAASVVAAGIVAAGLARGRRRGARP